MHKNSSELLNISRFKQEQAKQLILKTMEDMKKFEKYSQEVKKKINGLKGQIATKAENWHSKNFQKCQQKIR